MKKSLLVCSLAVTMFTARTQSLVLEPAQPRPNETVHFTYTPSNALVKAQTVEPEIYLFSSRKMKVVEPKLIRKGKVFTGHFKLGKNTNGFSFVFNSADLKDTNLDNGYLYPVFTTDNKPLEGFFTSAANFYSYSGEYLMGIPTNKNTALRYLEDGLRLYSNLANDPGYMTYYYNTLYSVDRNNKKLILEKLREDHAGQEVSEQSLTMTANFYKKFNMMREADSVFHQVHERYPAGNWVKDSLTNLLFQSDSAYKKIAVYKSMLHSYPDTGKSMALYRAYRSNIALAFARQKDFDNVYKWNAETGAGEQASNNNEIAWKLAEDSENLDVAKKLSYQATMYAKKEMNKSNSEFSRKQNKIRNKSTYSMYADTYGFVLYKLGEYKEGLKYAKEAATLRNLNDPEYNERYAMVAEKVLTPEETKNILEKMVSNGKATARVKDLLKILYFKNKGRNDFAEYVNQLEMGAKEKRQHEIMKSMVNEPAPSFTVNDLEGKTVRLEDYRGKVLVLDFWATWCGPCIASMPGMKKALDKYDGNDTVKFLFVDTWEGGTDKEKQAGEFMRSKNYPFYVLMDNENKMVEDFKVRGIPTKFIIDKEGRLRFRSIGFSGNTDDLAEEVNYMVELAGK